MENDEIKETNELPVGDDAEIKPDPAAEASARARELELENARLKGRLEAAIPASGNAQAANEQWKASVWSDMTVLSDDDFKTKYNVEKHRASTAILQQDFQTSSTQTKQQLAELRAENQLASKYADFFDHKGDIASALADAAPEVRQDPERLAKFMERAYLSIAKDVKEGKRSKSEAPARRLIPAFERPAASGDDRKPKGEDKDEIAAELRPLARAFGIKSESERKELSKNEFCLMNLGGGVTFEDPERGFQHAEKP